MSVVRSESCSQRVFQAVDTQILKHTLIVQESTV